MFAYLIRGVPEDAELTFNSYPVVSLFVSIFAIVLLFGPLPLCYFISKDQSALSEQYEDITVRHWVTVGLLFATTIGTYPNWYVYRRYKTTDTGQNESSGNSSNLATGSNSPNQASEKESSTKSSSSSQVPSGRDSNSGIDTILSRVGLGDSSPDESPGAEQTASPDTLVNRADRKRREGRYGDAIGVYESAITQLEAMHQKTPKSTENSHSGDIERLLADARKKLKSTTSYIEKLQAVREPLQNAESSFQTAVAEHVRTEQTPARRDYRQATDQYEQALRALDKCENDIFDQEGDLTVSITLEADPLPSKLTEWSELSESDRTALSEAGIGTLADISNVDRELIETIAADNDIDADLVDRLRVAGWWHGDGDRIFTSRATIERQRDRAGTGYDMLP